MSSETRHRRRSAGTDGCSHHLADTDVVLPPRTPLEKIHASIEAFAVHGYVFVVNTWTTLYLFSRILLDLAKAIFTLLASMWSIVRRCPSLIHFLIACGIPLYTLAFIQDPYLFGSPKEWLLGAFSFVMVGATMYVGFYTYHKLVGWYKATFHTELYKMQQYQKYKKSLEECVEAVNAEGKRADRVSTVSKFGCDPHGREGYFI